MKKESLVQNQSSFAGVDLRRFIRHPICLPLAYKPLTTAPVKPKNEARAESKNISIGGLLFSSAQPVKTGTLLALKLPFEDKIFMIKAKALRCAFNARTKYYEIAVSFPKPKEAFKVKMIEQVYLISEYRNHLSLRLGKEIPMEAACRHWVKRYAERFEKLHW